MVFVSRVCLIGYKETNKYEEEWTRPNLTLSQRISNVHQRTFDLRILLLSKAYRVKDGTDRAWYLDPVQSEELRNKLFRWFSVLLSLSKIISSCDKDRSCSSTAGSFFITGSESHLEQEMSLLSMILEGVFELSLFKVSSTASSVQPGFLFPTTQPYEKNSWIKI